MMIFYWQVLFVLLFLFLSHSYPFNFPSQVSFLADPNSRRSCLCSIFPTASLLCLVFFIGSAFIAPDYKEVVAIICFTLNIFFFFLFSFFFFQVSFRPFTVIQYFLKRLLVVQKLSIWGLGGSLQNSAVSNCGVCSSSLRAFVHQFVCVCVCVCVFYICHSISFLHMKFLGFVALIYIYLYMFICFRLNAGLMEVRHYLKVLFPRLLTWKCDHYGALER